MKKSISIIVPVYNGEKYISRCIESILAQDKFNLRQLEILLINDGSTDQSIYILNKYKKAHPFIIEVIDQDNVGVAKTRNEGIRRAKGKYLMFVDQDDWIDRDYCKVLFDAIEESKCDAVFSGMKRPDEGGKIINRDEYKNSTDAYFARFMSLSVWAKIHRAEFLRNSNIELFDNHYGEDIAFVFEEVQKTDKIRCITYCGYNWFYNSKSVSNTSQRRLNDTNVDSIMTLQNKLAFIDTRHDEDNTFFVSMITAYYIFLAGRESTWREFMSATDQIMSNLNRLYPDWDKNPRLLFAPKGTLPIFSIGLKVFTALYRFRLIGVFARLYCKGRLHAS